MKSFPTDYLGFVVVNRKFNSPMLPWVVPQIKKKTICNKVNLVVAGGNIAACEACKDQPLFEHSLKSTLKPQLVPANLQDAKGALFLYVLKGDDGRYHCHLFRATDTETVQELFTTMKEQSSSSSSSLSSSSTRINRMERETPQRTLSSAATLTSIGADISPSSSHFFEVYYVGKHRVNPQEITLIYAGNSRCFKVPETFIDDVLPKFRPHVLEKSKSTASNLMAECQQLKQLQNLRRDSRDSNSNDLGSTDNMTLKPANILSPTGQTLSASVETIAPPGNNNNNNNNFKAVNNKEELKLRLLSKRGNAAQEMMRSRAMSTGHVLAIRRESNARANDEQNRTMLLQIGRQDLRLISPDQKQVFLHKQLKDIMNCVQGITHPDHFGFISRDANSDSFVCFVFKCQSESVADDLVTAISQAFMAIGDQRKERPVFTCDHCPMVWYNKLSQDIDGQSDRKAQNIIITRMQQLTEEEQEIILAKYKKNEISNGQISLREQNQFLMTLLRIHCEAKQARHVHDTAENRSEFLNQYLSVGVGSTIFMKAKRSLTNSFDHLMKRKGSKDDFGIVSQVNQKAGSPTSDEAGRPRSLRVSPEQQLNISTSPKSPMMDIFFKVGNSPKMSPTESEKGDYNSHQHQQQLGNGSWRQAILNRVVTPNKDQQNGKDGTSLRTDVAKNNQTAKPRKRTKEELRELWKKAINQQVILIRMERENAKLRVRQEEATVKRIKLEYDELSSCARELSEVWDLLVSKESRISTKCDNQMLLQAIKQGVPRGKRGDVWQFLAEQFCLKQPPIETKDFPNYNTPYEVLLQQLTSQQHAILIDLGRTFPNHPYFSSPLGPGQLALFNLLKAYSLLDHEVGYCQGLSFVAGVLLLHMSEDQAFFLLRHLMFRRGLRKLYLPDMAALQLHLYQLSRLLHDRMPALYDHFDKHEVSPTLYAAPWLLTLFASQFPLGFVTRVFDLLFLESSEVIFKVAMALLEDHQDQLLICDSFEEIMEYLKVKVPAVDKGVLDRVMKRVFYPDMEIGKQLNEYRVEYQVLQEEMISVKPQIENMEKLEQLDKQLTQQNSHMHEQIEILMTDLHRLETARTYLQASSNKLEAKNRSLEVTVLTLGTFIQQLVEGHPEIDIPGDVRRIVAQLSVAEKRSQNLRSNSVRSFPLNVIPGGQKYEPMTKSNSTGRESKVVRSDSTPYPLKSALSQPNLSTRLVSSLFPNNSKLQRPLSPIATKNEENETKTVNIDIQITDDQENYENNRISPEKLDENSLKIRTGNLEKCASLPLKAKLLKASKSSYELGSVKMIPTSKLEDTAETLSGAVHPLDSCSDVSFNYGGTTKLKSIKSVRAPPTQPR